MKYLIVLLVCCFSQVLAQRAAPEITSNPSYAERKDWQAFLDWPQKFEDSFVQTHPALADSDPGYMTTYSLEPDWYLLEIQTYAGAYQPAYIYIIYNENWQEGFLLSFPQVNLVEGVIWLSSSLEIASLSNFNPDTKTLTLYSRSRGAGGCGDLSTYRFEYEFAYLVETRAQSCEEADAQGEDMLLDPSHWPVIWPSP